VTDADRLLDGLDPEQRAVATARRGPVRVLAGAGTGKTRAITHRIAHGVASGLYVPSEVLAVTFTTRAAGEMRSRLRALDTPGVQVRTFHAAALRQARYFWPQVFGGELPELVASKLSLLAEAASRCRVQADSALLRDLAGEVEWAKVSNVVPDDYPRLAAAAGRTPSGIDLPTTGRVFAAYEQVKRDRGRIDMEDVLLCAAAILTEDERVAATVRRQYKWFVVDEFQDVSPIQVALLDLWLGGRDDICVVGDPMQTIYSFAGASADFLTGFARKHPGTQAIELVRNYRSTPQVVEVANKVAHGRRGSATGVRAVVLRAQREAGPEATYAGHANEVDEAADVAARIERLRADGIPARDMAVLFRINAQSQAYEEALTARGIPYVVRGVERFFERPEVKQAVTLLRGAARAGGDSGDLVGDAVGVLSSMGWKEQAPAGAGAQRNRWESLQAMVTMTQDFAAQHPGTTLAALVEELERRAQAQHAPIADGVTLSTLHAAKGLEWEAVFCVGMHEGTVPIIYATTPDAVEEERRLFYVGVTRARTSLHVSWAAARSPGARGNRGPTRFLDGIRPVDPDEAAPASGRSRTKRSARSVGRCRTCGRPLGSAAERKIGRCDDCPATYDEELFERLRAWRSEQATAQKVPAYVVFTDATLTAIAESKPGDARELLKIPGLGKTKLDRYGEDVLALLSGDSATGGTSSVDS
jgi:DNA helicase-2/ATP-dependent DNA helicase PcrA